MTLANHTLHPTPIGVVSSAYAGHVVDPAWLSLGRSAARTGGTSSYFSHSFLRSRSSCVDYR